MELFKFFLPLKLIYLAAVVKFVIQYQKKGEETRPVSDLKLPYEKVSRIFVYSHVTSIAVLIILSAFNMGISFTELTDLLVFVESLFGVCIGYFITDMFGTKE
jgi:hypothetical protein